MRILKCRHRFSLQFRRHQGPTAVPADHESAQRRDLERQLAEQIARMKVIMDNIPAGIVLLKPIEGENPNFLITAVNRNVNKIAGFDQQLLYEGGRLAECLRPAAAQGMYGQCEIDQRIAERMTWYASTPDQTIWSIFPSVDGRFVKATRSPLGDFGFVVVTVDTSEQVRTERALAEQSAQFSLMLDNMPEGVIMFGPDLLVAAHSRRINAMIGVADGAIRVGKTLENCLRAAYADGIYGDQIPNFEDVIRERVNWYMSHPTETISMIHAVRGDRHLKFTRSPLGEYGMVVLFMDVTDQINNQRNLKAARDRAEAALEDLLIAQNRLVQAEKLSSLGQMVAGVAHEINTPLGISVTLASLISTRVQDSERDLEAGRLRRSELKRFFDETREACDLMLSNLQRGADLVHSFKQVATDQASDEYRHFDLGELLNNIVTTLGPVWRKAGHQVKVVSLNPIEVDGQPGVISQIMTNLITNSIIHGFEPDQKGSITITTALEPSDIVELRYTDSGRGISRQIRDKVFDPFFTTRRGSGNTGLGLHIVHNLVVGKLFGSIDLDSDEGHGVRFTVRFPRRHHPNS